MIKKWFSFLLAIIIMLSVSINSFVVYADEDTDTDGGNSDITSGDGTNSEEEEIISKVDPVKNNKGASKLLDGYILVSPDDDDKSNLDLYFNADEIAFKIVKKDKDGNILDVFSSNLTESDLGLDIGKNYEKRKTDVHPYDAQSMSLMHISYVDLRNTVNNKILKTYSYTEEHELYGNYELTGKGVSLTISYPKLNIKVPLVVEVDGQKLSVRIPKDELYENLEGAAKVREITTEMESIISDINKLIVQTRRLIKNKSDASDYSSYFKELTGMLTTVREGSLIGQTKSISASDVLKKINEIYARLERSDFFTKYPGLQENADRLRELTIESMEKYDIIDNETACGLYSLSVMPFLGSGTLSEDGYVFYPDGAGAISKFNINHPVLLGHYNHPVYSIHSLSAERSLWRDTDNPSIYPVFGVNKDKFGFLAIITEGDYDASIEYWPGNKEYVIGRIYTTYMFRRTIRYVRANSSQEIFDINRIDNDRCVTYYFLDEGKAEYSDMANTFREYLKENDLLGNSIKEGDKLPLAVDFAMGTSESGFFGEKTLVLTSYDDVQNILNNLRNDGVEGKIYSNLDSWTKSYRLPSKLNPDRALGGRRKLEELFNFASNNNISIGLSVDPAGANRPYSTAEQIKNYFIKDSYNLNIEFHNPQWGNFYFTYFSPQYIKNKHGDQIISKLKSYGANGADIYRVGYKLYYDYSRFYGINSTRKDTAEIFTDFIRKSTSELGYSSVWKGNMYTWKYATRIDSMPLSDTECLYSDQSVPFLQMVLHGNIAYSGNSPYNIMYDPEKQMLEYIEFGCMPVFMLTQNKISDNTFSDALFDFDWLYTSDVDAWYDTVVKVYKEFSENVGHLWSVEMVRHNELERRLKRVEYADGSIIYVNYNDDDMTFTDPYNNNEITIGSKSYKVVGKGE